MAEIAPLIMRASTEGVEVSTQQLRQLDAAAESVEHSVDGMAMAARRSSGAVNTMNLALREQQRMMRQTQLAGLGLTRQFSDIGVSIASGMPIWMVAIQQGSQIQDQFAQMKMEGVGVGAAMRGMAASFGPLLGVLIPVAGVAATVVAGLGFLHRELSKTYPKDITDGLGLTEEQLKRVETRTVGFGHTVQATFNVLGRRIMESPVGDALRWLGDLFSTVADWISETYVNVSSIIGGVLIGTFKTVRDNWRQLPAALGDAAVTAANAVIQAVEDMINKAKSGINAVLDAVDMLRIGTGQVPLGLRIGDVELGSLKNNWAGAGRELASTWGQNVTAEIAAYRAGMLSLADEIGAEALRLAVADALEEAGDPNKTRSRTGLSDREKAIRDTLEYIERLKEEAETIGLSAIAAKEREIRLKAAAALTADLAEQIRRYGAAVIDAMKAEALSTTDLDNRAALIRREIELVGASARQRETELAVMAEQQRLAKEGILPGSDRYAAYMAAFERNLGLQYDLVDAIDAQRWAMERQLEIARQLDDHAQNAARGLASAFGEQGRALGDLLTSLTGYREEVERIALQERELIKQGGDNAERLAMLERDRAQAQIGHYGDLAAAAKGFFREGSDGYKVMLALEQAYRLQQLIGMVQEMTLGRQTTAQSIADSMAKGAAASAAGAAKMFESLGPLAFPAVAAMLALLASLGLGGGRSGRSAAGAEASADRAQAYQARSDLSRDAAASAIAARVDVRVSADREGLNAYVEGKAAEVATPIAANAALTGYAVQREERRQAVRRARQSFVR